MGKTSRWIGQKYVCRKTRMQPKSKVELLRDQQDFDDPISRTHSNEQQLISVYNQQQQQPRQRPRHRIPVDEFDNDEYSIHDTRIANEIQRCETVLTQARPFETIIMNYLRLHSPSVYLRWLYDRISALVYFQDLLSVSQ